jgi:Protein of unknown function (DUF2924)
MEETSSPIRSRRALKLSGGSDDLAQKVAHLSALDAAALQKSWAALFGSGPPPKLGRSFMNRALAYRLQERALGALKPSTLRILDRVADGRSSLEPPRVPKRRVSAGTVLIREWRGVTHRVTVLDNDVIYGGRRYGSLSEVASLITGTHWSGPMFFGLRNRRKEAANG